MKIKIEKNVPITSKRSKGFSDAVRGLKAGDSCVLPTSINSAYAIATRIWGTGNVVVRKEKDGARVWRTK